MHWFLGREAAGISVGWVPVHRPPEAERHYRTRETPECRFRRGWCARGLNELFEPKAYASRTGCAVECERMRLEPLAYGHLKLLNRWLGSCGFKGLGSGALVLRPRSGWAGSRFGVSGRRMRKGISALGKHPSAGSGELGEALDLQFGAMSRGACEASDASFGNLKGVCLTAGGRRASGTRETPERRSRGSIDGGGASTDGRMNSRYWHNALRETLREQGKLLSKIN